MNNVSLKNISIKKIALAKTSDLDDVLAVEEPLEIQLLYNNGQLMQKTISITMRTPGNDAELAAGFLFTEGIIKKAQEVKGYKQAGENVILIELTTAPDINKLERHFYTSSSCGVCGKTSIDAVRTVCNFNNEKDELQVSSSIIYQLPISLRDQQEVFDRTGGLHASALFNDHGDILLVREDVGRHNALDKLIGAALKAGMIPLSNSVLLLSGRASFELIQKAAMAGIRFVAAVGAPSSLAVQMAEESNITLIGFLKGDRFNIYTGQERIII